MARDIAEDIAKGRVPNMMSDRSLSAPSPPKGSALPSSPPAPAGTATYSDALKGVASSSVNDATVTGLLTKWPILQDGDGGREVRALQVSE